MTTIKVQGADFSGGRIANYTPPVNGATFVGFVGDSDAATYLRNFGSAGAATMSGAAASIDAAFRRFNSSNFMQLPAGCHYTASVTMLTVHRSITPLDANFGVVLGSERDVGDGGRRGCTMVRSNSTTNDIIACTAFGTDAGALYSVSAPNGAQAGAQFNAGIIKPKSGGNVQAEIYRRTPTQAQAINASALTSKSAAPDAGEAAFPLRVGHNYRALTYGNIDVGFVAMFPRVLTLAEIDLMYASVAKRFAALGFTI